MVKKSNRTNKQFILLLFIGILIYIFKKPMEDLKKQLNFIRPYKGTYKITEKFGERIHPVTKKPQFHNGIDIGLPERTELIAPADGIITIWKDVQFGGGNSAVIVHKNGYRTGYAHLSEGLVPTGSEIKAGEAFALSGHTGMATGSHLHMTLKTPQLKYIDPMEGIDFLSLTT